MVNASDNRPVGNSSGTASGASGAGGGAVQIGVAGDWHGNRSWALRCIQTFADAGIGEIYHLGDFGIWPRAAGQQYLHEVNTALADHAITMFVTPGNHEDYGQINALGAQDRGGGIGPVQWAADRVAVLPRGHRWVRNGWSFVSLGGAPSIDRWGRHEGIDWWADEVISDADVARVVEAGPADVMLTHDAPDAALGTPKVASILDSNPIGWPDHALRYAAAGRAQLTTAFMAVQPRLLLHGHFHVKDATVIDQFGHPTQVVSLDSDGSPTDGNLVVLTLPARSGGEGPSVRWLPLRAGGRHSTVTGSYVGPQAPIGEWSLNDIVDVLNHGRSDQWRILIRVADRDGAPFARLLADACALCENAAARAYVRRVCNQGP